MVLFLILWSLHECLKETHLEVDLSDQELEKVSIVQDHLESVELAIALPPQTQTAANADQVVFVTEVNLRGCCRDVICSNKTCEVILSLSQLSLTREGDAEALLATDLRKIAVQF